MNVDQGIPGLAYRFLDVHRIAAVAVEIAETVPRLALDSVLLAIIANAKFRVAQQRQLIRFFSTVDLDVGDLVALSFLDVENDFHAPIVCRPD